MTVDEIKREAEQWAEFWERAAKMRIRPQMAEIASAKASTMRALLRFIEGKR